MKLNFAILYTNNLKVIVDFYTNIIGLKIDYIQEDRFASFKLGNTNLGIKQKKEEREVPGCQTVIIGVDDVESLYKEFKKKDVKWYKELTKQDWGTNFAILDPDGNKVEFVNNK